MGEAHRNANKNRKEFKLVMTKSDGINKIETVTTVQMHQYITNLHSLKNISHITVMAIKK
jgi:hypothetical protein